MTNKNLVSMVAIGKALGMKQISQSLGKAFKDEETKKSNYMVTPEKAHEFLLKQVLSKLAYREKAQELLDSKEYLEFTEMETIASTTKKANVQKKGTLADLRKYLELKGLTEEFITMLNNGELEEK
ncbi:MAG: hypothetical protein ACRDCW_06645 [Sarcina sp.]